MNGIGWDHELLWQFATSHGLDRRAFLGLMVSGGAAGVFAAYGVDPAIPDAHSGHTYPVTPSSASGPWFKNAEPYIIRGDKGLESRLESLDGLTTPNRLFFVRNNSVNWDVDTADWTLSVECDAISDPLRLTYQDIGNPHALTLISYLECAGNHCAMFGRVNGQPAPGSQWMTGAVGNGEWVGGARCDVLTLSSIPDSAHNHSRCRRKHPTRQRALQRKGLSIQSTSPPSRPRRMTSSPLFLDNPYPQVTIALNGRYLRSKRRK